MINRLIYWICARLLTWAKRPAHEYVAPANGMIFTSLELTDELDEMEHEQDCVGCALWPGSKWRK